MKKLLFITLSLCAIAATSCRKNESDFIITGKVVYADNNEPVKTTTMRLMIIKNRSIMPNADGKLTSYPFATDSTGDFTIRCSAHRKDHWYIATPDNEKALDYGGQFLKQVNVENRILKIER